MPQRPSKIVRRADADAPAAQPWYAVTADGASALRIVPGLTLGEHPDGALALNARAPGARWVIVEIRRGEASFQALESHRLVARDERVMDHVPLCDGLCLALPNNLLRISRSIRASAASGPTVSVDVAGAAPEQEDAAEADDGPGSAPEARPASVAAGRATPVAAAPPVEPAAGLRPPVAWALGAAALCSVLLAVWLSSAPPPAPGQQAAIPETEPAASSAPGPGAAGPEPASATTIVPLRRPATAVRLLPVPGDLAAEVPGTDPAGSAKATAAAPAARPDAAPVAPLLAIARQHLEAGRVTFPPGDNAVDLALAVLRDHPDHPGAMALLGRCTSQLLEEARAHRAAGRVYEARNTLEELLGFNPEHPEARRLWAEWVGTAR